MLVNLKVARISKKFQEKIKNLQIEWVRKLFCVLFRKFFHEFLEIDEIEFAIHSQCQLENFLVGIKLGAAFLGMNFVWKRKL